MLERVQTRAIVSGGSPVTDVAYLCHNCGSVHEVESIRENLILDLRPAASFPFAGQPGILDPRTRFRRWRMTRGFAHALWPAVRRPQGRVSRSSSRLTFTTAIRTDESLQP